MLGFGSDASIFKMTLLSLKTLIREKNARIFLKNMKMPPLPSWLQENSASSCLQEIHIILGLVA
jgi:hypothetical protein